MNQEILKKMKNTEKFNSTALYKRSIQFKANKTRLTVFILDSKRHKFANAMRGKFKNVFFKLIFFIDRYEGDS